MDGQATRVLVIEQDPTLRGEMLAALSEHGYRAHGEANGVRAPEVLPRFRPDALIVDTRYRQGPSGSSIVRFVRTTGDPAIIFTASDDGLDTRLAAFAAGADDFLTKPIVVAELLARLRAVLLRSGRARSETWEFDDLLVHEPSRTATRSGHDLDLTATQFALLLEFCRNPGRVLTKDHLLRAVWDGGSSNHNLVEAHIHALRGVLDEHGPPIIRTVRGAGYRLQTPLRAEGPSEPTRGDRGSAAPDGASPRRGG